MIFLELNLGTFFSFAQNVCKTASKWACDIKKKLGTTALGIERCIVDSFQDVLAS